ncbi:MAG: DUF192 domain-containing protein [Burkholderiales bacterium]|nr:DUF192 domain-containing protein [Burkholderiales bacterium]
MNAIRPLFATLLLASSISASAQTIQKFPTTQLSIGMYLIKAEVAATEADREQGLMFREKMAPNEGMIFVFDGPATVCMWMKNTLIPLSVAFLDSAGTIVNIEEMKPQTLDSHCGKKNGGIRYALEMNANWFKQKNIKPGTKVEGLPK